MARSIIDLGLPDGSGIEVIETHKLKLDPGYIVVHTICYKEQAYFLRLVSSSQHFTVPIYYINVLQQRTQPSMQRLPKYHLVGSWPVPPRARQKARALLWLHHTATTPLLHRYT